jgi:ectoine hydroxylase-related dioxygenase (phytanoyl-CoA dioxygenase family)
MTVPGTANALEGLPAIPPDDREALRRDGYLVVSGLVSADQRTSVVAEIDRLLDSEGEEAGREFRQEPGARRLANLVDKSDVLAACIAMPPLLAYAAAVIGPSLKLSSLNARSANPHNGATQPLHADGGARPDERGAWVCNLIWMLDDFRADNGPMRVVPGTQHDPHLPAEALADPLAPHPGQRLVTGQAGDLVVLDGHLWHGGLPNTSSQHRRALHVYYCRRDKPQQQYQRGMIGLERQRALSPLQRWICALDDADNDRLSSSNTLASGFLS